MTSSSLSLQNNLLISCGSAAVAEIATLPADTIKVYIQTHQPAVVTPRLATRTIWQQHGFRGFYQSWAPSVLRQTAYTGVRLGLYDHITNHYPYNSFGAKMFFGGVCGLTGNLLATPFDVVKTKLQYQPSESSLKLTKNIWKEAGLKGFYNGWIQTSQRSIMISSIQLPLFFTLQEKLKHYTQNTPLRTTISSVATTFAVTSIVYPIDLAKSYIMTHQQTEPSTIRLLKRLIYQNGIPSLYRGISMSILRSIPHFLVTGLCYEALKKYF